MISLRFPGICVLLAMVMFSFGCAIGNGQATPEHNAVYDVIKDDELVKSGLSVYNTARITCSLEKQLLSKFDEVKTDKKYVYGAQQLALSCSDSEKNLANKGVPFMLTNLGDQKFLVGFGNKNDENSGWLKVDLTEGKIFERSASFSVLPDPDNEILVNPNSSYYWVPGDPKPEALYSWVADENLVDMVANHVLYDFNRAPARIDYDTIGRQIYRAPEFSYGFAIIVPDGAKGDVRKSIDELEDILVEGYGAEKGKTLLEFNSDNLDCSSPRSQQKASKKFLIVIGSAKNSQLVDWCGYSDLEWDYDYVGARNYWGDPDGLIIWGRFAKQESLDISETPVRKLLMAAKSGFID